MNYMNIPVTRFFVASEDEDLLTADNDTSFEDTDELLNQKREDEPDKVWSMYAEINA